MKKSDVVRWRVESVEKNDYIKTAKECGYENLSAYFRALHRWFKKSIPDSAGRKKQKNELSQVRICQ